MAKKGKGKTSKVKKTNKKMTTLRRQGKLKHQRHKKPVLKLQEPKKVEDPIESDQSEEDVTKMFDPKDIENIRKAVAKGKFKVLYNIDAEPKKKRTQKRKADDDVDDLETEYEQMLSESSNKRTRQLLPFITKTGIIRREIEEDVKEFVPKIGRNERKKEVKEEIIEDAVNAEQDDTLIEIDMSKDLSKPVSVAEMLSWRVRSIAKYKYKIGLLSSALLENPEEKVLNIARLLEVYDDYHPELQVTLKKLVMVSLLEVFKDILPSYQIKHQNDSNTKLKKDTQQLQTFEKSLLKGYRGYLTKLEKVSSKLYRKQGDTRERTKHELSLGELSIKCLCEILVTHPYFNYSTNVVRLLVPFLDNKYESVRNKVSESIKTVFQQDKRGEITLEIVRRINDLVKTRKHSVKPDVIKVLNNLKIKDINLDKLKEDDIKEKKLQNKKSRIINLSKKEKKRQKRIAEVEKELLETKAEENKQVRSKILTEVIQVAFTIYFRVLKSAPNSGLLSAALQGLSKFTHCINIEFYQDLVTVLNSLMNEGELKLKEQLNCIFTVFKILSGQGESLSIDPNKFYGHLYANMFNIDIVTKNELCEILIQCLETVVVARRNKLNQSRLLAFVKRLTTISLQQNHHMTIACLTIVRQILLLSKSADILLEQDANSCPAVYRAELSDPEYCNASCTSLFELSLLQKHYHPTVRKFALNIAQGVPSTGRFSINPEIGKLSGEEIFKEFDPTTVCFKPAVPPPSKNASKGFKNQNVSTKYDKILNKDFSIDFSELLDNKKFKTEGI